MERNRVVWAILAQKEGLDPHGKEVRSRWIKLLKEIKTNPKTKSFVASIYETCRIKPEYNHLFLSRFQIEERERRAAHSLVGDYPDPTFLGANWNYGCLSLGTIQRICDGTLLLGRPGEKIAKTLCQIF